MKRSTIAISRYPFGVAADVCSIDFIERGTEFWDAKGEVPATVKLIKNARYGKRRTNGREEISTTR